MTAVKVQSKHPGCVSIQAVSCHCKCTSVYMTVSIPGGWPVCLWPAQLPDDRNIWKWGCHVRCPSWRSVVCRFPPVTEMKGCPRPAASEATLPPLGALEIWREGEEEDRTQVGKKRGRGRAVGAEKKKERAVIGKEGKGEEKTQTVNNWLHSPCFCHSVNHRSKPTTKILQNW